jgi:hypothetical protein
VKRSFRVLDIGTQLEYSQAHTHTYPTTKARVTICMKFLRIEKVFVGPKMCIPKILNQGSKVGLLQELDWMATWRWPGKEKL